VLPAVGASTKRSFSAVYTVRTGSFLGVAAQPESAPVANATPFTFSEFQQHWLAMEAAGQTAITAPTTPSVAPSAEPSARQTALALGVTGGVLVILLIPALLYLGWRFLRRHRVAESLGKEAYFVASVVGVAQAMLAKAHPQLMGHMPLELLRRYGAGARASKPSSWVVTPA
jgi:hypothetical protein